MRAAHSMMAVDDDVGVARQLGSSARQRRERNQPRPRDARVGVLVWLANVDQQRCVARGDERREGARIDLRQCRVGIRWGRRLQLRV
jgi:hypothetical protein